MYRVRNDAHVLYKLNKLPRSCTTVKADILNKGYWMKLSTIHTLSTMFYRSFLASISPSKII